MSVPFFYPPRYSVPNHDRTPSTADIVYPEKLALYRLKVASFIR